MPPAQLLIVDDEANIRFVLKNALKHEGYIIDTAANGAEALHKLAEMQFDLLLLDLHMEPVDGLTILNAAREQDEDLIVIILTGYSSVESAVEALRLGAFDYLFKPAMPETIRQRVQVGLQKRQQSLQQRQLMQQIDTLQQTLTKLQTNIEVASPPTPTRRFIRSGDLVIDNYHRQATFRDAFLELTTTEFDLLLCLVKAAPNPLTAQELVSCALGYHTNPVEARNTIKYHIHHLRRKIDPSGKPSYIKTVRHKGYMWSAT